MKTPIIVANWKMHGTQAFAREYLGMLNLAADELSGVDIAVCPPSVHLSLAKQILSPQFTLGAQNMHSAASGPYTGEISADMLLDIGCQYVIVGHFERRALLESDGFVADKIKSAMSAGLVPVLCVGETEDQRANGATNSTIRAQLEAVFDVNPIETCETLVIAYEPIWAIGNDQSATPQQIAEVHAHIREFLQLKNTAMSEKIRIIYGGSVKASNADSIFAQENVDGAIVGSASLEHKEFISICQVARKILCNN